MLPSAGERPSTAARRDRPAVVEHVDSPQSTSDGRTTIRSSAASAVAATVLSRLRPAPPRLLESAVLAAATVLATGVRFAVLRTWVGGHASWSAEAGRPADPR